MSENTPNVDPMPDVLDLAKPWLNMCGCCDAGLPMGCTCINDDPRLLISELVAEIVRLRAPAVPVVKLSTNEDDWRELSATYNAVGISHAGYDVPEFVWLDVLRMLGADVQIEVTDFGVR